MKVSIPNKLESTSASKKAQKNAAIFFGKKYGPKTLTRLEVLSKEKLLSTPDVDSMYEFLKKASPEQVEKALDSKSGTQAVSKFKSLVGVSKIEDVLRVLKGAKFPKNKLFIVDVTPTVDFELDRPTIRPGESNWKVEGNKISDKLHLVNMKTLKNAIAVTKVRGYGDNLFYIVRNNKNVSTDGWTLSRLKTYLDAKFTKDPVPTKVWNKFVRLLDGFQ